MPVPVQVNLNPDTRKVDQALARIRSQARNVDFGSGARSLNKLSQPLGRITGQATEFEKSLEASNARVLAFGASVAVINKLSQAFSSLVSNTIKVEATFAKINTVLGGTEKQIQQFGRSIFQVAKDTGTSFDQVAEGALELARQGLSAQESINRISTALKLVRVTGIDAEKAVGGLTAAIKGFEGSGLTVAQIADKLSQADVKFAVSTEDLIDGLQRASASARVAGVSFDELLASITVVQERTQRGGAVIGNAFKTIFSYIARPETINYLESLGIQVVDAQGRVREAIPIIKDLGKYLEKTGMQSATAATVIQKVAGVRQRDILINLIEDLNSGQSQFNKALMETGSSVGSLDAKQKALNNTLEYFISRTVTAGQEFAAMLGKIGFTDAAKSILDSLSSALEGVTDLLDGESIGSKFAQGLVRGIGGILTGPGLILVGGIFVKLFVDLAKFGMTSLKNLLGINRASQEQQALQKSIFQTLVSNEAIQREILLLGNNKVAQAKLLTKVYNDQIKALTTIQSISSRVAPTLLAGGLRGGVGGVTRRRGGTAAGGYISEEASAISRGVGGAPTSAKVAVIPNFAFGRGERGTMVANTSEYYVPNYAGGGDAIFNQNMVRSMGLPKGAMKINAAGGYIPNFAKLSGLKPSGNKYQDYRILLSKGRDYKGQFQKPFGSLSASEANAALKRSRRTDDRSKDRQARADATKTPMKLGNVPEQFAMIVAQTVPQTGLYKEFRHKDKKYGYYLVGYKNPLEKIKKGVKNDEQLDKDTRSFAINAARQQAKLLTGGTPNPKFEKKLINKGAISALSGSIFEAAVSAVLRSKDFDSRDPNRTFDFYGSGANKRLQSLFSLPSSATNIEAKIRDSKDSRSSMRGKILKKMGVAALGYIPNFAQSPLEDAIGREQAAGVPINQIRVNQSGKLRNAQNPMGLAVTNTRDEPTGAIPNYAVYNDVAAAKAGGLSGKQILAGFGGKAAKDEMEKLAKATKVQTKASETQTKATTDNTTKFLLLSMASQGIASAFGTVENKAAQLALGLANSAMQYGFYNSMIKDAFTNFSKSLRKQALAMAVGGGARAGTAAGTALSMGSRVLGGVARALPVVGTVASLGMAFAPFIMDLMKTRDAFSDLRQEIKSIKASDLIAGNKDAVASLVRNLEQAAAIEAGQKQTIKALSGSQEGGPTDMKSLANKRVEELFGGITSEAFGTKIIIKTVEQIAAEEDLSGIETLGLRLGPTGPVAGGLMPVQQHALNAEETVNKNILETGVFKDVLTQAILNPEVAKNIVTIRDEFIEKMEKNTEASIEDHYETLAELLRPYSIELPPLPKIDEDKQMFVKDFRKEIKGLYSDRSFNRTLGMLGMEEYTNEEGKTDYRVAPTQRGQQMSGTTFKDKDGVYNLPPYEVVARKDGLEQLKDELAYTATTAKRRQEIELAMARINLEYEQAVKKQEAQEKILDRILENAGEYGTLTIEQADNIKEAIKSGEDFTKVQEMIKKAIGDQGVKQDENLDKLFTEYDVLLRILGLDKARLKAEEDRAKIPTSIRAANDLIGAEGWAALSDNLANKIPNQFADNMTTALNNLATGAYDSIGDVFGQLALDFGTMIMQEINRAIAAQIAGSIIKSSFGQGIGNWFKGVFGFASGGYISQGSGIKDDVPAMLMGGEYVVRKAAVQKYGVDFLESLNQGQVQGYAAGGEVQGAGNYYKDFWSNSKGNMIGGEASNARLARAKQTDFFMPGYRGAGAIIGKENLLAFAMQGTTSGATDTFSRRGTGFSFDTELQSANLSGIGRMRAMESPIGQGLMSAKQQAFDLYTQRIAEEERVVQAKKEAEQARSETFKKAVIGAAISAVAAGIAGSLNKPQASNPFGDAGKLSFQGFNMPQVGGGTIATSGQLSLQNFNPSFQSKLPMFAGTPFGANGGYFPSVRNFANGGAANAMLMGGEYVVSPQSTSMVGKSMLDDINNMRYPMPAFANGGAKGAAPMKSGSSSGSADIGELNININIEKSGNASVDSSMSSDSSGDAQQSKEFAKKIKDVVVKVIQEEKRVSGSLFTRNK